MSELPRLTESEQEIERYRLLPPARLREWNRLRALGMARIVEAEYLCECGQWHKVNLARMTRAMDDHSTVEALTVIASQRSRMVRCPKGGVDHRD